MTLHVFNPSHDEALAANSPYYTPSAAARRLESEWASLPQCWAAEGDLVLLPGMAVDWECVDGISPWGWDPLLKHRLLRLGAPQRLLPSDAALQRLRALSSRATAVALLPLLRAEVADSVGESRLCHTEQDVAEALEDYGETMLKAPWSCSGRGVFRIGGKAALGSAAGERAMNRACRILRQQGAIVAEPFYPGGRDCALEFHYEGGQLFFDGPSRFATGTDGEYLGQDGDTADVPLRTVPALQRLLPPLLGADYEGPLGVDMLQFENAIHPCIEINLRQTMGRAALLCGKRGLPAAFTAQRLHR